MKVLEILAKELNVSRDFDGLDTSQCISLQQYPDGPPIVKKVARGSFIGGLLGAFIGNFYGVDLPHAAIFGATVGFHVDAFQYTLRWHHYESHCARHRPFINKE